MVNKNNKTLNIAVFVIGILVIVMGYFFIDFNGLYKSLKGETKFVTQDKSCDLHKQACFIKIQDGTSFELSVEPKTIELMKPLDFIVKSNNQNFKDLHLNIYATNMFMGKFNVPLKNMGDGAYKGTVTLPTCIVGDMKWNVDIEVEKMTKSIGARFQFKTDI